MGFMHHSNYLVWYDLAQEKLLADCGTSYAKIMQQGFHALPIRNVCNYALPVCYDDEITVRISVTGIQGVKMSFAYEFFRARDGAIVATGESEHIIVNSEMRPVPIERALPGLYGLFMRG